MKILYIIDALGLGGRQRRLIQLLKKIDENNISGKLILLSDIPTHYREIYDMNIEVIKLKRKINKDPRIVIQLFKICKKWKPDIIDAWGSMPAIYSISVAKLLNIKIINGMIADAPNKLDRSQYIRSHLTFPFSDAILANSYAGLKSYNVRKNGFVIHNGFDINEINKLKNVDDVIINYNIKTQFIVGMVSRIHHSKDFDTLLTAIDIITSKRNDVSFVLVGDGDLLEFYKTKCKNKFVIFTGKQTDVYDIINIFDIAVLSTFTEGISNSIVEYMALGKAVVATDGGGTKELIVDNETGFIIPQQSPTVLADKIEILLNNPNLRETMGRKGKQRIIDEFNLDKMVNAHVKLYNKLLNKC